MCIQAFLQAIRPVPHREDLPAPLPPAVLENVLKDYVEREHDLSTEDYTDDIYQQYQFRVFFKEKRPSYGPKNIQVVLVPFMRPITLTSLSIKFFFVQH